MLIYTIGHSTRPLDDFIQILKAYEVTILVDVRTVPRSRRNPQFNRETLPGSLASIGIGYVHLAALGGLRRGRPDSPNTAWRNASFRAYADYMGTPEFAAGLAELMALAETGTPAIMCAEAVPWRCHRSLIADALLVRACDVLEIMGLASARPHKLTPFARVEGDTITYPEEAAAPESQGSIR